MVALRHVLDKRQHEMLKGIEAHGGPKTIREVSLATGH
jgi:hypothetical protein